MQAVQPQYISWSWWLAAIGPKAFRTFSNNDSGDAARILACAYGEKARKARSCCCRKPRCRTWEAPLTFSTVSLKCAP